METTFKYSGLYKCECGATFENSQQYNGHKSFCKEHHIAKYGNTEELDNRKIIYLEKLQKANNNRSNIAKNKKQQTGTWAMDFWTTLLWEMWVSHDNQVWFW